MFVFVVTYLIFCLIIVVVLFVVGLENYLIVLTLIVCIFLIVILFFCNNSKEGFCVDFPICMHSSVKFVKLGCNTYDFVESFLLF